MFSFLVTLLMFGMGLFFLHAEDPVWATISFSASFLWLLLDPISLFDD